jgi:ferredoxin
MINITIHAQACRGCQLCVDICPTKVFFFNETVIQCEVVHAEDCIGCLSCAYLCPSNAISHEQYHVVRNFYRVIEYGNKLEKYL